MKKLKTVALVAMLSSSVTFAEPQVKLEGVFDFNSVVRSQKKLKDKKLSANNKNVAFNTSANITAQIKEKTDDLTYGAKIVFTTTTAPKKSPGFNGSHIFLESEDFGKIEVGAPFDVSTNMQITGSDVSVAAGGFGWDSVLNTNPNDANGFDINIGDFHLANFTSKNFYAVDREPSRKINYYTPKMNGFQFGITWIPDSTNGGADKKSESSSFSDREINWVDTATNTLKKYKIRQGATNAFALGATYETQLAEATSLKLALTGEFGKAIQEAIKKSEKDGADYVIDPNAFNPDTRKPVDSNHKLKNLKSYDVGAKITHGNFGYSVSYGDLCKSFAVKAFDDNKNTNFYSTAVSYTQGPIAVSLTYGGGSNKKNTFNSIALGSEYKVASGLLAYAEVGYAKGKGKGKVFNATSATLDKQNQKFSGTAFILGLKVKF
jgi:hypothetical protein